MLKGHAKIELTDVNTGEKQVIEEDNMITNAIEYMCKSTGFSRPPILYTGFSSDATSYSSYLFNKFFGGIMLWESALNDDPDDFYIADENVCVGYGCKLSNGTINSLMGTYNESESGYQDNGGYKHVWDFATNQANGQISAVSLVPEVTGRLGLGLPASQFDSSLAIKDYKYFYDAVNYYGTSHVSNGYTLPAADVYLYIDGDYLYAVKKYNLYYNADYADLHISRNNGKLVIQKYRRQNNMISVFERARYINTLVDEIEVVIPSNMDIPVSTDTYYGFCNYDAGYIYLTVAPQSYLRYSSSTTSLSFSICKINCEDYSTELINITVPVSNDTSYTYPFASFSDSSHPSRRVINNKLFLYTGNKGYNKAVDLSDVENWMPLVSSNGGTYTGLMSGGYLTLGNNMYMYKNSYAYSYILNTNTLTMSVINAEYSYLGGIMDQWLQDIQSKDYYYITKSSSSGGMCKLMPPHFMTTKNNLDTPITKNSAQTMKITYTLTEAE